jgi:hypothetical protein
MRVIDFDISIESFISICIIETVGAIFHEYKPNNFFTNFWHSGDKSDLLPILQKEKGDDSVYLDETWVNQNHCTDYMWLPNDRSDAPKIPSGKGKHWIVLHAGTRSEGLVSVAEKGMLCCVR